MDLCGPADGFPEASFDVVLSSFTLEHFADPPAALANIRRWLRPGGTLVATTVNRRHPFVEAYLALPAGPRSKVQALVKASAADAHPLVGACNTPAEIRRDLAAAGFESIDLRTVGHLARAWGRHLPTFALGLDGRPARAEPAVASLDDRGGRQGIAHRGLPARIPPSPGRGPGLMHDCRRRTHFLPVCMSDA